MPEASMRGTGSIALATNSGDAKEVPFGLKANASSNVSVVIMSFVIFSLKTVKEYGSPEAFAFATLLATSSIISRFLSGLILWEVQKRYLLVSILLDFQRW